MNSRRAVLVDVKPEASTNLGLWLDRYPSDLEQEHLRTFLREALTTIQAPSGYVLAYQRRQDVLSSLDGGYSAGITRMFQLAVRGRAIIGIGVASVRETSLSLLRPWGVPFIPGSALKGLCSHVAHEAGGEWARPSEPGEAAGALHRLIFGDVTAAGAVTFHDAWWRPERWDQAIAADTMTVHHKEYYGGTGAPLDSDEPSPVSLLSTSGTFLVALSGPAETIACVVTLLETGLRDRGIGAKTSAGYGRATLKPEQSKLAEKIRDIDRPPVKAKTIEQDVRNLMNDAEKARTRDDHEAVREAAQKMIATNPDAFAKWRLDPKRTEHELIVFASSSARDVARAPSSAPPPPKAKVEATWASARAHARKEKNRTFIFVEGASEGREEGKLSKGRPSPELLKQLEAASEFGVEVEVIIERNKLMGIQKKH